MKMLCLGDSNTYGYDPRSYFGGRYAPENRWTDILQEMLGWEIINAGENGRRIPVSEREYLLIEELLEKHQQVDLVAIMLGTNDLLEKLPVESILERMEVFLKRLDPALNRIILIAPPSLKLGEWVPDQSFVQASEDLISGYQNLAEHLGVNFVAAEEWNISLTFDGVHFAPEGHSAFAEGLYYFIKRRMYLCWKLE